MTLADENNPLNNKNIKQREFGHPPQEFSSLRGPPFKGENKAKIRSPLYALCRPPPPPD